MPGQLHSRIKVFGGLHPSLYGTGLRALQGRRRLRFWLETPSRSRAWDSDDDNASDSNTNRYTRGKSEIGYADARDGGSGGGGGAFRTHTRTLALLLRGSGDSATDGEKVHGSRFCKEGREARLPPRGRSVASRVVSDAAFLPVARIARHCAACGSRAYALAPRAGIALLAYRPPFPVRASTPTPTMSQSTAISRTHETADSTRLTSRVRRLRRTRPLLTDRTFRLRAAHLASAPPDFRLQPARIPLRARPISGDRLRPRRPLRAGDSAQASAVTCAPAYVLRVASNARAHRQLRGSVGRALRTETLSQPPRTIVHRRLGPRAHGPRKTLAYRQNPHRPAKRRKIGSVSWKVPAHTNGAPYTANLPMIGAHNSSRFPVPSSLLQTLTSPALLTKISFHQDSDNTDPPPVCLTACDRLGAGQIHDTDLMRRSHARTAGAAAVGIAPSVELGAGSLKRRGVRLIEVALKAHRAVHERIRGEAEHVLTRQTGTRSPFSAD
ncbi:hypothetical protein B0H10DRAFT_2224938 [Mycena sp. CBHHK59/15]|nr:hypothetical protein B0H10DRAFT_2224938 [Mycena sp. CBHHK59/15]